MTQNMIEPLLALGEIERAEQLLGPVPLGRTGPHRAGLYLSSSRVRALAWRGRVEEAEQVRREWRQSLLATAKAERQVWYCLVEMEVAIAVAGGDWSEAIETLRRMAVDEGTAISNQRRLLLEGGWLVAEARAAGIDTVAAADAISAAWRAQPLRQTVTALGTATGLHAPEIADDSELTARETQVLELIAEGLSNRQIGERLFISAKTASVHVSAILRKLGVSTRTEAAVRARG